jgi:branched-chain amino acid transport system ATP-binding protein
MTAILRTQNVTKRFGGLVAVNDFSVEVEKGSISSIIGPNGAGKTTFFNCVTGFYAPDEGTIEFSDKEIQGLRTDQVARLGIARTYQNIRLFSNMTTLENILVGMHPRMNSLFFESILGTRRFREEEKMALDKATELLKFVDLQGLGDHVARNLPYGAQRRLEIARALASDPQLLLLDEPTAGMNIQESADLTRFIQKLRDERGITILMIEHDMRVVMGSCEKITVLDYGSKIAEGKAEEIQRNPDVIEAYLGRGAASGLALNSD